MQIIEILTSFIRICKLCCILASIGFLNFCTFFLIFNGKDFLSFLSPYLWPWIFGLSYFGALWPFSMAFFVAFFWGLVWWSFISLSLNCSLIKWCFCGLILWLCVVPLFCAFLSQIWWSSFCPWIVISWCFLWPWFEALLVVSLVGVLCMWPFQSHSSQKPFRLNPLQKWFPLLCSLEILVKSKPRMLNNISIFSRVRLITNSSSNIYLTVDSHA